MTGAFVTPLLFPELLLGVFWCRDVPPLPLLHSALRCTWEFHLCFPAPMCLQEHTFICCPEMSLRSGGLRWDRVSAAACLNPHLLPLRLGLPARRCWFCCKKPEENLHK